MDHTCGAVDRYGKEQQILAQQVDATGQAVAGLMLDMMSDSEVDDQSMHSRGGIPHRPARPVHMGESSHRCPRTEAPRPVRDAGQLPRFVLPKMQFPLFTGENPKIRRDKCVDYFRISNI